jgi:hypothetical protein
MWLNSHWWVYVLINKYKKKHYVKEQEKKNERIEV